MTKDVIEQLPEQLKKYLCPIKKASKDTTNKIPMSESTLEVVDFDKIPNEYARGRGWQGVPNSNDALYIDINGKCFFIEFKNGSIKKEEIYRKIYDSLIMLMEWEIIPDFDFVRKNINYILVYNEGKYNNIQNSIARDRNYDYFRKLANKESCLFGIDKFEKYLFDEAHTYTQDEFKRRFIQLKEREESESSVDSFCVS